MTSLNENRHERITLYNTGFASGGVSYSSDALCVYLSSAPRIKRLLKSRPSAKPQNAQHTVELTPQLSLP